MTANYQKLAIYDVRKMLWQELQNAGLFSINNYYVDSFGETLIPIIPAQQVPEFNNLLPGKPYIIYDVVQRDYNVQWWMSFETMTLAIVSKDSSEIQTITNFLIDLLRRYDQSAGDVNLIIDQTGPFTFHYFKIESADPIQAFSNEGGFMTGLISFSYSYTRALDPVTGRYS